MAPLSVYVVVMSPGGTATLSQSTTSSHAERILVTYIEKSLGH